MKTLLPTLALSALLLLGACAGHRGQTQEPALKTRNFPMVEVPSMLEQEDAIAFAVDHFWDKFFSTSEGWSSDSTTVLGVPKSTVEQMMANYIGSLDMVPLAQAKASVAGLYPKLCAVRADTSAFASFTAIVDSYMFDPNSPLRNEDYYQPFVSAEARDTLVDPLMREVYARKAAQSLLNGIGTIAADFRFSDRNGRIYHLHGIKAEYTLLFFSNPGCHACKDIIETLNNSLRVQYMLDEGRLAVANVYIDEQLDEWYNYMSFYPKTWYNGYDPDGVVRSDELYDVRAIPSLYLLDKDKRVILKDAPEQKMFEKLESL